MSDDLDTLVEWLDNLFAMLEEEGYHTRANTADFARKAITTLRTQLAEVSHMLDLSKLTTEAVLARAERAEAALAAQIEVDAGIADSLATEWWGNYKTITHEHSYSQHREGMSDGADEIATAIRAQPHDRTALDRMLAEAREKALREAIHEGMRIATFTPIEQVHAAIDDAILALIEAPNAQP